eukprot:COSAG01_NODE_13430_length_1586_cov_13.468729_2_plen_224_part_01
MFGTTWYDTQTGAASPLCAQVWDACVHDCLQCGEAVDRGVSNQPQVSELPRRRRPQPLWAREWRSQVVTGPVRGAANGAAFIVGVRADRRSSAPSVLPFFVVCCVLVCSVGCLRGCPNSLMLRRCGIIWMVPAVLPTGRPAAGTLSASCLKCQAACGGRLMCRYARLPLPSVYRHYGGGEWCGGCCYRTCFRPQRLGARGRYVGTTSGSVRGGSNHYNPSARLI